MNTSYVAAIFLVLMVAVIIGVDILFFRVK